MSQNSITRGPTHMCDHDQRVQEIPGAGGVNQQFPEHGSWDQTEVGSSTIPRILWKIWHDHGGILELKKAALIMFVSFPETCVLLHVQCAFFLCLHFLISKLLPLSPTWSLRTRFVGGTIIGARLAAMCGLHVPVGADWRDFTMLWITPTEHSSP